MREDIDKLLVERERYGSERGFYRASLKDDLHGDNYRTKASMKPDHRSTLKNRRKELNENLSPLYRFLESSCGRKWNDVYSEVRKVARPDSAVRFHVFQHLDQYVEKAVIMVDGKPCDTTCHGGRYYEITYGFWVHPETGILHKAKRDVKSRTGGKGWGYRADIKVNRIRNTVTYTYDGATAVFYFKKNPRDPRYADNLAVLRDDYSIPSRVRETAIEKLGFDYCYKVDGECERRHVPSTPHLIKPKAGIELTDLKFGGQSMYRKRSA